MGCNWRDAWNAEEDAQGFISRRLICTPRTALSCGGYKPGRTWR